MGSRISFFTDYHQQENRITNYCGLILKMLYQERPIEFEKAIANMLGETQIAIGPVFEQQVKTQNSIPDLRIRQSGFVIAFETKIGDAFTVDQIKRHLDGFEEHRLDKKILFLLGNVEESDSSIVPKECREYAKSKGVALELISFEYLIQAIDKVKKSEAFDSLFEEFQEYLDNQDVLPKWKYMLDVVNCGATLNEIDDGVYVCPDSGGTYRHQRAKYFGPYAEKKVTQIREIKAIVIIDDINQSGASIRWNNTNIDEEDLIKEAKEKITKWEWRIKENSETAVQVFLLGEPYATDFTKDSKGGMFGTKVYFWEIARGFDNAESLAKELYGRVWSEFGKGQN